MNQRVAPGGPFDAVVVGGGIAGLTAAWDLRAHRVLVLERDDRFGGRILSVHNGPYWANLGAHVFPNESTLLGQLARDLGTAVRPIPGSLRALATGGRIYDARRAIALPLVLPLRLRDRVALCRAGIKLAHGIWRFGRLEKRCDPSDRDRRAAIAAFENARTFADYLGPLPRDVDPLFRALARRAAGETEQVAAGAALLCGARVLGPRGGRASTARSMIGGTQELPRAIADRLGSRALLNARVLEVADRGDCVSVVWERDGERHEATAAHVIVATDAPVARQIVRGLPSQLEAALGALTYGSFVSAGVFTRERGPTRLDPIYAVAVVGAEFDFLFNQAQVLRGGPRRSGGSLMMYRSGAPAAELAQETDAEIERRFLRDLYALVPELHGEISEVVVQRWPQGAAYSQPGRTHLQPTLERAMDGGRIHLAGDYLDSMSGMEESAKSGRRAAAAVAARLAAAPAPA